MMPPPLAAAGWPGTPGAFRHLMLVLVMALVGLISAQSPARAVEPAQDENPAYAIGVQA